MIQRWEPQVSKVLSWTSSDGGGVEDSVEHQGIRTNDQDEVHLPCKEDSNDAKRFSYAWTPYHKECYS